MKARKKHATLASRLNRTAASAVVGGVLLLSLVGSATALELDEPGAPPTADPLPNWSVSANISLANDLAVRGISYTSEGPSIQGGFDLTNDWFYMGIFGSGLNAGAGDKNNDGIADSDGANIEIDYYAGIQKSFKGIDFDLAYLFYSYPNAIDFGGDVDMWEIRGIVSTQTASGFKPSFTAFYTPQFSYGTGRNLIFEGKVEQTLPQLGPFSPTLSALLGYNDNQTGRVRPDFWFWNAGLTLGFAERFSFDLRYWDSDIGGCRARTIFQCEERVVAKMTALIGEPDRVGHGAAAPPPFLGDLSLSANVALASDYVFRGQSQIDEHPAIQGGFELAHGGLYAGVWASNLDFGGADANGDGIADSAVAQAEYDWYGGVKKDFHGAEVDLGVIYYTYPNAFDRDGELDYWELKAAASAPLGARIEAGVAVFYAWDYTGEVGENWVLEGTLEKSLPRLGPFSPTLGVLVAYNAGDQGAGGLDYWYWNAGLGLGFSERFAFDLRYWDSDIGGCGGRSLFQCDERVVAKLSAKF